MAWRRPGLFQPAPNAGAIDPQEPPVVICSREGLRAFAANTPDPDRVASLSSRGRPRGGRTTQPRI